MPDEQIKEPGIYGQSLGFPEELDAIEPYISELAYIPTKFKTCIRCKKEIPILSKCTNCIEVKFESKLCVCGHSSFEHSFYYNELKKYEIDICGKCLNRPDLNKHKPGQICNLFVEEKIEAKEGVA